MLIPYAELCVLGLCLGGGGGSSGGGGTAAPEIDGSGAITALALIATLAAVLYHRVKG